MKTIIQTPLSWSENRDGAGKLKKIFAQIFSGLTGYEILFAGSRKDLPLPDDRLD